MHPRRHRAGALPVDPAPFMAAGRPGRLGCCGPSGAPRVLITPARACRARGHRSAPLRRLNRRSWRQGRHGWPSGQARLGGRAAPRARGSVADAHRRQLGRCCQRRQAFDFRQGFSTRAPAACGTAAGEQGPVRRAALRAMPLLPLPRLDARGRRGQVPAASIPEARGLDAVRCDAAALASARGYAWRAQLGRSAPGARPLADGPQLGAEGGLPQSLQGVAAARAASARRPGAAAAHRVRAPAEAAAQAEQRERRVLGLREVAARVRGALAAQQGASRVAAPAATRFNPHALRRRQQLLPLRAADSLRTRWRRSRPSCWSRATSRS